MQTEEFYAITPDGTKYVRITATPIEVGDNLAQHLTVNAARKMHNLRIVGGNYGGVGMAMLKNGVSLFSIRITRLPMRAFFNIENGVMVPVFDNHEATPLELSWTPPKDMQLIYAITVIESPITLTHSFGEHYLVAMDPTGQMYRLPLSNVFDDGKLCHGMKAVNLKTAWDVVQSCLDTFEKSSWNDHLYKDATPEKRQLTKDLFQFEPKDNDFKQLEPKKPWTRLSIKFGNEFLQANLVWKIL